MNARTTYFIHIKSSAHKVRHMSNVSLPEHTSRPEGLVADDGPFHHRDAAYWTVGMERPADIAQSTAFLRKLAITYLDIFCHGKTVDTSGWGEFAVCPDCGHLASIEDVFGTTKYQFLGDLMSAQPTPQLPDCPACTTTMRYFYDLKNLIHELRGYLSKPEFFGALLCDEQWQPSGMIYAWRDTIRTIWDEKISHLYAHSTLTRDEAFAHIEASSNGVLTPDTRVLYLAELGMTMPSRNQSLLFSLFQTFARQIPDDLDDTHTLVTSEPGKRSYLYLEAAGHAPVARAPDMPLTILSGNVSNMRRTWHTNASDFNVRHETLITRWKDAVGCQA